MSSCYGSFSYETEYIEFLARQKRFGSFGSFYDTTIQTGIHDTVLTMGLNTANPWNNGVTVVNGNRITMANPGVYNLALSAQIVRVAGNAQTHIHIWLSQNGNDVPFSASQVGVTNQDNYEIAAWNFFFRTQVANEFVQLRWIITSNVEVNAVQIRSAIAAPPVPAIPGLIVTVNQVGN